VADPGLQQMLLQATERAEAGDFAQAAKLSQQLLSRDEADVDAQLQGSGRHQRGEFWKEAQAKKTKRSKLDGPRMPCLACSAPK